MSTSYEFSILPTLLPVDAKLLVRAASVADLPLRVGPAMITSPLFDAAARSVRAAMSESAAAPRHVPPRRQAGRLFWSLLHEAIEEVADVVRGEAFHRLSERLSAPFRRDSGELQQVELRGWAHL